MPQQTKGGDDHQTISSKVSFSNKMLILGCGAVARCVLPLLQSFIEVPMNHINILDKDESTKNYISDSIAQGVRFWCLKITETNFEQILKSFGLVKGDVLIDLAYDIDTTELLKWCRVNNIMYINASIEVWNPYYDAKQTDARDFTLYSRHMKLRKMISEWGDNNGPTAVLDHGANPGLVSHLTKQALEDIANRVLSESLASNSQRRLSIQDALHKQDWGRLAMELGVKVIHVSERDTQTTSVPKKLNEFVNTWSVEGFHEEGVAPAELGWGTHEKTLPSNSIVHESGPKNQILLKTKGMNTMVRSWVPTPNDSGDIYGMVIRHGEAFSISDYLSVKNDKNEVIYRPTVHYAYCPAPSAIESLHELRMRHYKIQPNIRLISDEIDDGADILGCLLMGHDFKSWWIGSILDIHQARKLVPHQSATTVQVAASFLSALMWMIKNPRNGVRIPDELPYKEILAPIYTYLGKFVSKPVNWDPIQGINEEQHCEYEDLPVPKAEDMWQFSSFLVSD